MCMHVFFCTVWASKTPQICSGGSEHFAERQAVAVRAGRRRERRGSAGSSWSSGGDGGQSDGELGDRTRAGTVAAFIEMHDSFFICIYRLCS